MDYDRKSTVSSFYGQPKSSADPMARDYSREYAAVPTRRDDASSFYAPDRQSTDRLASAPRPSAGYNRASFYPGAREEPLKGGRDEEDPAPQDAWDVYADFNNAGPRYSTAYGLGQTQNQAGYSQLPPTPSSLKEEPETAASRTEMVTVPGLGAEWAKSELRDMTKSGRKEKKAEGRAEYWRSWRRGERGLFGRYFNRRSLVWCIFIFCCIVGIVLAFTIPRVPSFAFNAKNPLVPATGAWATAVETGFSRAPTNFSFPAFASLQLNTQSNFLPLKFTHIDTELYDGDTGRLVAKSKTGTYTVPAKDFPEVFLPLNFTYNAVNTSDQTWANWYNACRNRSNYPDKKRPALKLNIIIKMGIFGLIGDRTTSTPIPDADCPIELPTNAA